MGELDVTICLRTVLVFEGVFVCYSKNLVLIIAF